MKKILIALAVLLIPGFVLAADFRAAEEISIPASSALSDDLYAAGGIVRVGGQIDGDAFLAGGDTLFSGNGLSDVFLSGGSVEYEGTSRGDVRMAGGDLSISGSVGEDLLAAAGNLSINPQAVIAGEAYLAGGNITISGVINGDLTLVAGRASINGEVRGNVNIVSADEVVIGRDAMIAGALSYKSANEAKIDEAARIGGEVTHNKAARPMSGKKGIAGMIGGFVVMGLLAYLTASLVLGLSAKDMTAMVVRRGFADFWRNLGIGLVATIVTPVIAIILMISVLGWMLGTILMGVYALMIVIATIYAAIIFGAWVMKAFNKGKDAEINWKLIFVGVALLSLVSVIPVVGWIIKCIFFLVAFGTLCGISQKKWQVVRKKWDKIEAILED